MSQEKFYIPKHLDDIPKFLLWDVDVALFFITPFFLGFLMGKALVGLVCAALCVHYWKKTKGMGGKNLIRSLIYWHYPKSVLGFNIIGLKTTPDSKVRNYIG